MLTKETITFGKYKNNTINTVLKDRNYCKWLLDQEFFETNYPYLYSRIKNYNPLDFFLNNIIQDDKSTFIHKYKFFNLKKVDEILLDLNEDEKKCYNYYLKIISILKNKIIQRIDNLDNNIYDIKAPSKWLQKFEEEYNIKRDVLKKFLNTYSLPNIPYIIEDIKKEGGMEYKGAKSFKIAKKNSEEQEKKWEGILKDKFGEDICVQFKYDNCIFDFLNINTNTIYECKLNLKDFNEAQYDKYCIVMKKYKIKYLINNDCIVDIYNNKIFTINKLKYDIEIINLNTKTKFDNIKHFKINHVNNLHDYL